MDAATQALLRLSVGAQEPVIIVYDAWRQISPYRTLGRCGPLIAVEAFMLRILALLCFILAIPCQAETFSGTVHEIIDGDTIVVDRDGTLLRVRLYGIDAPEFDQPFASEARRFVKRFEGRVVRVDVVTTDRYRRLVARVDCGTESLNSGLVAAGLAWWYPKYAPRETGLANAQIAAMTTKQGMWADRGAIPPWTWRARGTAHSNDRD